MRKLFLQFSKQYRELLKKHGCVTCSTGFLDKFLKENKSYQSLLGIKAKDSKSTKEAFFHFSKALDKVNKNSLEIVFSEDLTTKKLGDMLNVMVLDQDTLKTQLVPYLEEELSKLDNKIVTLRLESLDYLKRARAMRKKRRKII